jgi:ankyrin repeat protein
MFERNTRGTAFICIAVVVVVSCMLSAAVVAQDLEGQPSRDWKLLLASEKGDVKQVRMMLDLGASPICRDDEFGGTPLHWAAYRGHVNALEVLLNRGADVNLPNKDGRTALILAAGMGHESVVKVLLERGARPEAAGSDGRNAEDWARRWHRTAVLKLLHPEAAKVAEKPQGEKSEKGTRRRSVKPSAQTGPQDISRALVAAAKKGAEDKLRSLLEEGADPNTVDNSSGSTVLHLAVRGAHVEATSVLLEKGADPNAKDRLRGLSALMEASERGPSSIVKMLLDKGADPNAVGPGRKNALILAACKGRTDVVTMLIEAKADIKAMDDRGRTALQCAVKNGRTEVAALLLNHSEASGVLGEPSLQEPETVEPPQAKSESSALPPATPESADASLTPEARNKALLEAAEKGRLEDVERLIRSGADPDTQDGDGATPLIVSATHGHIEVAEALLKSGANVNARNAAGLTPLSAAVDAGHTAVAELLIKQGADVNAKANDGSTPFDRALLKVSPDMKELLVQHGATLSEVKKAEEKQGESAPAPQEPKPSVAKQPEPSSPEPADKNKALIDALNKGDMDSVRRLLDRGAAVNAKGPSDTTPLMVASMQGNLEAVKLLVGRGADPKAKDSNGKTALSYAGEKGFREIKDFLQPRTSPEEKPRPQEKEVSGDQPPQGKQRVRAVSPETKASGQTKPK